MTELGNLCVTLCGVVPSALGWAARHQNAAISIDITRLCNASDRLKPSVHKLTSPASDNAEVWRWDSDPFGVAYPTGSFNYNLRFPGQYYDAETGMYNNVMRDYEPATGRYYQADPVGLSGGLNRYVYVGANPLSRIDPSGLSSICINKAAGTATIYTGNDWKNQYGTYPVGNNAKLGSRGPRPNGTFTFSWWNPYSSPTNYFGPNGNFIFNNGNCNGCGFHSGGASVNDETDGCFRSTNAATKALKDLYKTDPLKTMIVGDTQCP